MPMRAEIGYLASPVVVFFIGFLTAWVATIGVTLVACALAVLLFQRDRSRAGAAPLVPALAAAGLTIALIGFPSGPFTWDWFKHWALLNELGNRPWPIALKLNGSIVYLRFYVGAYLVPALIHKILPSISLTLSLGAWLLVGAFLVFRAVGSLGVSWRECSIAIFLMLLLGGADIYADHLARAVGGFGASPWLGLHPGTWAFRAFGLPLEFTSMVALFIWVPHQCIATFLVTAMLLYETRAGLGPGLLGYGALSLWSPYGMIGLLPLVLVIIWQRRAELWAWRTVLCTISGAIVAVVMVIYLATDMPTGGACFICIVSRLHLWPAISIFLVFEMAPYWLILHHRIFRDSFSRVSLATLIVLPFLYGNFGDIVMRGSMGPLFVLVLRSIETMLERNTPIFRRACQALALVLCVPTALSEVRYVETAGAAYHALPVTDSLRARWVMTFATRTDYTAAEFLGICGWQFEPQYFSKELPRLSKPAAPP